MKADTSIERLCVFCRHCTEITGREDMLCRHHGAVAKDYSCRKFVYDPLKRIPGRAKLDIPSELFNLDN